MKDSLPTELCAEASDLIKSGIDGLILVNRLTQSVDDIVVDSCRSALEASGSSVGVKIALLAVGGYGRMEMMPYSDIDIVLLARTDDKKVRETAQSVLYKLWDRGLNISHSFRTLKGCADEAAREIHIRTSLMDCRFLVGDETIIDEFRRDVYNKLLFKDKKNFTGEMIREIDRRHKAQGDSLYLLEPNVKEGRGGLRDINAVSWLCRSELRIDGVEGYKQFMKEDQYRGFLSARNFLLKARASIHICSAAKNDVLLAEHHDNVAALMGFRDTDRFFASEIMMRVLYYKSKSIVDMLGKVVNLCGKKYFSFHAPFMVKKINDAFFLSRNEIIARDDKLFSDTSKIIEAFHIYSATGKEFSYQLEELIKNAAGLITKQGRSASQATGYFKDILRGNRVFETMNKMHETGVLDRFMPEFGRLTHLVILESFHQYTVDEHSLLAIRNIERLRSTKQAKLMYLADILKKVKPEVLYLSILLHDIGKGVSRRHEEAGYIIIKGILERLAVEKGDRQAVEFLVANHVFLSKLAMTRDIDAPETVAQLAERVGNQENLDALYMMTYADMSAVNSSFWTEWKASILHELYCKTSDHLRGATHDPYLLLDDRLRSFVQEMPERYMISNTADEIRTDYSLSESARKAGLAISIAERNDSAAEFTIMTYKMARLFSRIVGAMSSRGLNIVRARLFTGTRGMVVRKIVVSNWKKLYWKGMEQAIRDDLRKAIMTNELLSFNLPRSQEARSVSRRFELFVEIENETSDRETILEVMLPDKIGLLYNIAIRLHANNIDILSAVINTDDSSAHDVFYLQKDGGKLELEDCLQVLNGIRTMGTEDA